MRDEFQEYLHQRWLADLREYLRRYKEAKANGTAKKVVPLPLPK
jgi:hypothetical protein